MIDQTGDLPADGYPAADHIDLWLDVHQNPSRGQAVAVTARVGAP